MKKLILVLAVVLTSCAGMTQEQKDQLATTGATIASQVANAALRFGVATAASKLGGNPYADSAAQALWTMSGQDVISIDQVKALVTTAGDPNAPDKWSAFGAQVGTIMTKYAADQSVNAIVSAAATAVSQLGTATPIKK